LFTQLIEKGGEHGWVSYFCTAYAPLSSDQEGW